MVSRSSALLLCLAFFASLDARTYYVDIDAPPGGDGLSWNAPFTHLSEALDLAASGDEIRVAEGIYRPDQGPGRTPGDRHARFEVRPGVTLIGGWQGDPAFPNRQGPLFPTILCGDLADNDARTRIDWAADEVPEDDENSYQVVRLLTNTSAATTVLDSLSIRCGHADGPTLFEQRGAGVGVVGAGVARLEDCTIEHCRTRSGGAAVFAPGTTAELVRTHFRHHRTTSGNGGSVLATGATLTFESCEFLHAQSQSGGHVHLDGGVAELSLCFLFAGHASSGGGIAGVNGADILLERCTIRACEATDGGGMFMEDSTLHLDSTLVANNRDAEGSTQTVNSSFSFTNTTTSADYSLVRNATLLTAGTGNLNGTLAANRPRFENDYDSSLQPGSPCIGAGNPALSPTTPPIGAFGSSTNIIHVDADVTGGSGDGSSWADAYSSLADALASVSFGSRTEIWIAEGIYHPDEGSGLINNDPDQYFEITPDTLLYGGFAGNETSRFERDPDIHKTILSGDIDQNDTGKDADGINLDPDGIAGTNSYHLVSAEGARYDHRARLDGLYITGGHYKPGGTGFENEAVGAGIFAPFGGVEIINCTIIGNQGWRGGGFGGSPENTFILSSLITLNDSNLEGGGIRFAQNADLPHALIVNSAITGNNALDGGGLFLAEGIGAQQSLGSTIEIIQCTFDGNQASNAGSIQCEDPEARILLANSVLWRSLANTDPVREIEVAAGTTLDYRHSSQALQTLDESLGNLNLDEPLLFDTLVNDGLTSFIPFGDLSPIQLSPLREAGDGRFFAGNRDLDGESRRFGSGIDIGAREFNSRIHRVDPTATGDNDGRNWIHAFTSLQSAFDAARAGDEIWLAGGVHRVPDAAGFLLERPVQIYGGFAGNESEREERDPFVNPSILTADLDANDTVNADGITATIADRNGTNASRVIFINILGTHPANSAPTRLDGFHICAASGASFGGGIYQTGLVTELVLNAVHFSANNASSGGAIYATSSLSASGCIFSHNEATTSGGAIHAGSNDVEISISNSIFTANISGGDGGALDITTGGTLLVSEVLFNGNSARDDGGAAYFSPDTADFIDCTFLDNTADGDGGALHTYLGSTVMSIVDSSFTGNEATTGGAVLCRNDTTIDGSHFEDNHAIGTSQGGGALHFDSASGKSLTLNDSTFLLNTGRDGGALRLSGQGEAAIHRCRFAGNSATSSGGAIVGFLDPLLLESCELGGNTANVGGAINLGFGSDTRIVNCTLQGNRSDFGAVQTSNAVFSIENTIIWNNAATLGDPDDQSVTTNLSTATYSHSLLHHLLPAGTGNLDGTDPANDPLFNLPANPASAPTTGFLLNLQSGSPAINAGENTLVAGPADRAFKTRIHGGTVDLGAFEFGAPDYVPGAGFATLFPGLDPDADDNHNGASNFLDYATGLDPTAPAPAAVPTLSGSTLTAWSRAGATDFVLSFEASTTLDAGSWDPLVETTDFTVETETSGGITTHTLTLLPPALTAGKHFYRARYEPTP